MTCKICRSSVQKFLCGPVGRRERSIYYHCPGCQFIFIDPAFYLAPEKEKERYSQHINTEEDRGYVDMLSRFLERAALPFTRRGGKALDFGGGPGPVLAGLMEEIGFNTDVYDIYFAPEKVYTGKKYDLITCTEVLEHLVEPMKTLALLKSLLEPGGILAIMTMFHRGVEHFKSWWYRRDATHISFFHPETLRYIAAALELEIVMMDEKNTLSFRR